MFQGDVKIGVQGLDMSLMMAMMLMMMMRNKGVRSDRWPVTIENHLMEDLAPSVSIFLLPGIRTICAVVDVDVPTFSKPSTS